MEKEKSLWSFIWRWGLFSMIILAIFWGIWFLIAGRVPVFDHIRFEHFEFQRNLILPFSIPRAWDVLAVILWPTTYLLMWRWFRFEPRYRDDDNRNVFLGFNIVMGILSLFILSLPANAAGYDAFYLISISIWFLIIVIAAIIIEFMYWDQEWYEIFDRDSMKDLIDNINFNLSISMSIGLVMIISFGLVAGVIIAIINFILITIVQLIIKFLLRPIGVPFRAIGRWLACVNGRAKS